MELTDSIRKVIHQFLETPPIPKKRPRTDANQRTHHIFIFITYGNKTCIQRSSEIPH